VQPCSVIVDSPPFGHYLHFLQRVEDLSVQKLVAQLGVEALAVAVLLRRAGFDHGVGQHFDNMVAVDPAP
jgi:anion-transporting  ArsA/GET3 family ATPase